MINYFNFIIDNKQKLFLNLGYVVLSTIIMQFNSYGYAKDTVSKHNGTSLWVVGQIYPIQEEDLFNFILHRIQAMQQTGDWQKLENQFRTNVANHADRPSPLTFLSKAVEAKSWNYDPSILVPYDLKDMKGRIFAKAGTTVNPLQFITIHKTLIFFDGDDKDQVNWVAKLNEKLLGKTKLILVNGSVSEQIKLFHQPIYFDQMGRLASKFHLQHVPAVVKQEDKHLKISEIVI
jgi:conjugal transfer pilus assembly protein TraW